MRIHVGLILCLTILLCALGCGNGSSVKQGDRFEVLVDFRVDAAIQSGEDFADGFSCMLPAGTILEAASSSGNTRFVETTPVMVGGKSEMRHIIDALVPEAARRKVEGHTFTITISTDLIGKKLKKL